MTLVELLLVVMAASLFVILFAASEPDISEERQAALTVARTYDIIRASFLYYEANDQDWPEPGELDEFLLDTDSNYLNGFGQQYVPDVDAGVYRLYQLVPEHWSGYITNNLERTRTLSLAQAQSTRLDSQIGNLDRLYGLGYTALESTIDHYGNLHFAFVRRQFESSSALFDDDQRADPSVGRTEAVVFQPDCGDDSGFVPAIHYTVRGACSFYPRHYEHYAVTSAFSGIIDEDVEEEYRYTTWGYQFPIREDARGERKVWVISLHTYEKWYQVAETTETDSYGFPVIDYDFTEREDWSPSQELCGQQVGWVRSYENKNLDNEDNSAVDNADFFRSQYEDLLYVDAWVSCQPPN